jgi:D-alanyl-D-alanine carboxypeptidase
MQYRGYTFIPQKPKNSIMKQLDTLRINSAWLRVIALVLSFLLLGTFSLLAQGRLKDEELDKQLKILVDAQIASYDLVGISVAVQIPFEEPWLVSSGYSYPAGYVEMHTDMAFNIASYTKTMVATLAFMMVEQGLIKLDDQLSDWLPNYQHIDNSITIRQLLNHTSGVYNYTDHEMYASYLGNDLEKIWTPEELLSTLVRSSNFHPGERCEYSNTNYLLLGMILKAATDTEVSVLLKTHIFEPLGMINTCLPMDDPLPLNRVYSWEDTNRDGILDEMSRFEQNSMWSMIRTCSGIFSNTYDVNTFMNALFVDGVLISEQSLNLMMSLAAPNTTYGHGLQKYVTSGKTGWGHSGGYIGFSSAIFHFPENGYNITILINQRPVPQLSTILDEVMETILTFIATSTGPDLRSACSLSIDQNYPNPFRYNMDIEFNLPFDDNISLKIFDTSGRLITPLIDSERMMAGHHKATWNGADENGVASKPGIYFYRLSTSQGNMVKSCLKID